MRQTGLALVLWLALVGLWPTPSVAQGSRAVDTCARTALQQAMLVMSVERQTALRDARGRVVGTRVDMRVNALGKKRVVSCDYISATRTAVIRPYQQGTGGGNGGGTSAELTMLRRDALRTCQRAAQQQGLMLDGVVRQQDVSDRRGRISGGEVILRVYQSGRPAQLVCGYDYATRRTALELRRPTLR